MQVSEGPMTPLISIPNGSTFSAKATLAFSQQQHNSSSQWSWAKNISVFFTLLWSNGWFLRKSHCQPCDTGFSTEEYKSLTISPTQQVILFFDWYPSPALYQFSQWFWFTCTKPAQASKEQQLTPDTSYLLSLGQFIAHSIQYYFNIKYFVLSQPYSEHFQGRFEGEHALAEPLSFTPQIWLIQANLPYTYISLFLGIFMLKYSPMV